mmetsp:Transcript_25891/g.57527  ORF Transcript_25891/g.57527 Transcript_25891/m.57527 type:complete len:266 (+) Transcript_25891:997-1794(+)
MSQSHHHPFHLPEHIKLDGTEALLKVRVHHLHLLLELSDVSLEAFNLLLLLGYVGIRGVAAAGGALDFLEEVAPASLELLVVEGNVLGRGGVEVGVPDGLGLHLAEAVEVQLTGEGAELVVVKVLRDDARGKDIGILDDEHFAVVRPRGDGRVTGVNHFVCFLEKDGYGSVGRLVGIAGPLLLPPALPLGLLLLRLGSRRGDGSRGNLLLPGAHGAHPPTLPNEHVGKRAGRWWGDGIDGGAHYVNAVNFRYVDFGCWIGVGVDR